MEFIITFYSCIYICEVFFSKIIGFKYAEKFIGVTVFVVIGGLAKFKKFPTFNLWLD